MSSYTTYFTVSKSEPLQVNVNIADSGRDYAVG
jgi:hypothetical protein